MTEQISFPPLHDLPPGELERRKQHLLGEITLYARPHRFWATKVALLRPRFALPAVAAVGAAVAAAVFVSTLGGPTRSTQEWPTGTGLKYVGYGMFPGAGKIAVADAAATLGAPVILPSTSFVQPSDATEAEAAGDCPYTPTDVKSNGCTVSVRFPAQSMGVAYIRPLLPDTPGWYSDWAQHVTGAQVISLNGVPALETQESEGPSLRPGWVEFALGQTRVHVGGYQDSATLEAAAQSIIDQASAGS